MTLKTKTNGNSELKIVDKLALEKQINISSYQLPIINFELFDDEADFRNIELSKLFEDLSNDLKEKLNDIFNSMPS